MRQKNEASRDDIVCEGFLRKPIFEAQFLERLKRDVLCRSDVLFQLLSLLDILTGDFSSSVFQPAVPVRSQSDSRRFGDVFKLRGLSSPIVT